MPRLTYPPHARRARYVLVLALAGFLAGCIVGPGTTPDASRCPSLAFGADQIQHPAGATDVVLRMQEGGGLLPMGMRVTEIPQFTLYGDGTVIFKQIDTRPSTSYGSRTYLPLLVGHLDEEQIQAELRFALTTGRLANACDRYDSSMIYDAGTTTFTINALGGHKVVSIYALLPMTEFGPDAADRHGFAQLADRLGNFRQPGSLTDVTPYDPQRYRVVLLEGMGEPAGEPQAWPWTDLTPAAFRTAGTYAWREAILGREQVANLLGVPNGGHIGVWVKAPDNTPVQFAVRPLLPDEVPQS